ncbi:DUF4232 domain-containing protein [Arthrobacter jiangjiafuii]|uniref:DUF4232 domain-containing protein n=1 Tax=Arthrobacter jiangjiafuii TaxID=2817475 RepID=A0A975M5P3_9MICC|nr:DUF4232 domain-containing protein [Arthrobacter jiangjiafuii]MBP3044750.1 DUF4232 domain-containing protein [Arthrobacter jiangjiafuii]QWC10420.1 DUF4232 domain-containing protein [Arthrobacter jiangjiafuii]
MNTRSWKSSSVFALALGAVLAVSGCGSSGDEDDAPSSSPSSSSPSASASPSASGGAVRSSPAPTPSPTDAAPVPDSPVACSAALLSGSAEDTAGGGAAGSVYRTLVLTNVSAAPCTAAPGYPGVSYLDAAGQQIGAAATRSTDGPAAGGSLVLEPGQSAVAELRETRAQNYGDSCQAQPATQLLVYPPEDLESVAIAHEALACANSDVELLSVGTLQKR